MIDVGSHNPTILHVLLIIVTVSILATLVVLIYLVRKSANTEQQLAVERFAAVEELRRRAELLDKEVAVRLTHLDEGQEAIKEGQEVIKHELGAMDGHNTTPTTREKIDDIDSKTEVLLGKQKKKP